MKTIIKRCDQCGKKKSIEEDDHYYDNWISTTRSISVQNGKLSWHNDFCSERCLAERLRRKKK